MGNPHDGDAWQTAGKSNRTSSRKINSACCHLTENITACTAGLFSKGANRLEASDKQRKKGQSTQKTGAVNVRWIVTIMLASFFVSIAMSYLSNEALNNAGTIVSFLVLLFFIALGIVFDMIGMAATSATEKEFHSMAAHKVRGAKEAVWMTRNAEKVSSICNDVVGDICGIISGATGALIIARLATGTDAVRAVLISLLMTGFISALTIGGKAAGKGIAITHSGKVLFFCGRVLSVLPIVGDKKK